MILRNVYCEIFFTKKGEINKSKSRGKPKIKIKCDKCGKEFVIDYKIFEKRVKLIDEEYCGKCARPLQCRLSALKGAYDEDGNLKPNIGRFSRERVDAMNKEEYKIFCEQRKRASDALFKKLEDPIEYEKHYKKVFKNSKIGYISKGQREIYEILKEDGFELEKNVRGINCDIVNIDKKIVIEYYGDFFHANPRKYEPDFYIKLLNCTAKEKWNKDRKRNFVLRNNGFKVIIIWENAWKNERDVVLTKLKQYKSDNWIFPNYHPSGYDGKLKQMSNIVLKLNKLVKINDVKDYLKNGWVYTFNKEFSYKKYIKVKDRK